MHRYVRALNAQFGMRLNALRWRAGLLRALLAGCRLEPGDQLRGHPSAVFDRAALRLGPLADPGGVQRARRFPAPAAGSGGNCR